MLAVNDTSQLLVEVLVGALDVATLDLHELLTIEWHQMTCTVL